MITMNSKKSQVVAVYIFWRGRVAARRWREVGRYWGVERQ